MTLGEAIKIIRIEKDLSQGELATRSGIAQTTVSQIEIGNRNPSDRNLMKLCRGLNIPVEIVYLYAIAGVDVPESKKELFKRLFPTFKEMMNQLILIE